MKRPETKQAVVKAVIASTAEEEAFRRQDRESVQAAAEAAVELVYQAEQCGSPLNEAFFTGAKLCINRAWRTNGSPHQLTDEEARRLIRRAARKFVEIGLAAATVAA